MNDCCKDQTTSYCPECGANLKVNSLAGLVQELEARLETAYKLSNTWKDREVAAVESDKKKVANGLARSQRRITQLTSWIAHVNETMEAI